MPVPMAEMGKQHLSLLLYLETRVVDHRGTVDKDHLRCNGSLHPQHAGRAGWQAKYGTVLANGTQLPEHDDWHCLDDLVVAGLVLETGTGLHPLVQLTEDGWTWATRLRRFRASKGRIAHNWEELLHDVHGT